ncbi:MAG: ATP-binding cassette domain-containing protein [Azoarcus sp.]|jgi:ATPase subunit of ABC transporter with duplicated ATPase domains|nr:ATP-binding cassette domain-containing protein [Azoarcus sp.]
MTGAAAQLLQVERLVAGWLQPAHQPVSFTLARGEILALAGPNGAGKSTLLSALAGGGARVFAGNIRRAAALRAGVQTQHPPPVAGLPLSGAELLALTGASPRGLPPWLSACLPRRLDKLSGGQRQYLALWSILQAPADLLLLDEPANHLDKAGLASLPSALRARAAQGAGIVLVLHDAALARTCCDRLLHLEPLP